MAKKAKEISVEDKLRALYDLQIIDRRIDEIRAMRGELPLEVEDLESEVAGLETRMEKVNNEIADLDQDIKDKLLLIKESEEKKAKYAKDQGMPSGFVRMMMRVDYMCAQLIAKWRNVFWCINARAWPLWGTRKARL